MGLFKKLLLTGMPAIDWEMTPEFTFGTYESWGGTERVRNKKERVYYFFIDAWGELPKLRLMERGIKHARVVAEILAPPEMVQKCVNEQGKVAFFERTHPINEQLKRWLLANIIEGDDDSKIIPLEVPVGKPLAETGLPGRNTELPLSNKVQLPHEPAELSEEDVVALIKQYNFIEQQRNPQGSFPHSLVDNGDALTVTDRVTGLMWQRGGTDIMSSRSMKREVARINKEQFAGYADWRLPSLAEALSLLESEKKKPTASICTVVSPTNNHLSLLMLLEN